MSVIDQYALAIDSRDMGLLARLVHDSASIDARDEDGRTPLIRACLAEVPDMEIIGLLLESGARTDLHDNDQQWTALHFAARDGLSAAVGLLLNHGAPVDSEDVFGNTPLARAVLSSDPNAEVIRMLLARGADPDKRNRSGVSPRSLAQRLGHEDLLRAPG